MKNASAPFAAQGTGTIRSHGAKLWNQYDLDGLVDRLKELEPEFRSSEELAKATRQAVFRRGRTLRANKKMSLWKNRTSSAYHTKRQRRTEPHISLSLVAV